MIMNEYEIFCSGVAPRLYPTYTIYGLLWYDENHALEIPKRYPYSGEWGQITATQILNRDKTPIPFRLSLMWYSVVEKKVYDIELFIPINKIEDFWRKNDIEPNKTISHIVVGMAPYGDVAVWINSLYKSVVISWEKGQEVELDNELLLFEPIANCLIDGDSYLKGHPFVQNNLKTCGFPHENLYRKYMQQFTYRYQPLFEKWDDGEEVEWQKYKEDELSPEFEYIEEYLFDGTFNKLHDNGLLKYHKAGKPKKLAIKWHIKKSEYTAYFWFEDEKICSIFERFYGAHPDTKTDFIIRIDAEKKKYELALYRQGLKEPQIISEDAYQLLVFKNKFEDYRSDNYNQDCGAWIW